MGLHKDFGDPSIALMEEMAEAIQVIAKMHRFNGSWNEVPPGKEYSRWMELVTEMHDVMHQWERLRDYYWKCNEDITEPQQDYPQ